MQASGSRTWKSHLHLAGSGAGRQGNAGLALSQHLSAIRRRGRGAEHLFPVHPHHGLGAGGVKDQQPIPRDICHLGSEAVPAAVLHTRGLAVFIGLRRGEGAVLSHLLGGFPGDIGVSAVPRLRELLKKQQREDTQKGKHPRPQLSQLFLALSHVIFPFQSPAPIFSFHILSAEALSRKTAREGLT